MYETIYQLQFLLGDIPLGLELIYMHTYIHYILKDRGEKDAYLWAKRLGDSGGRENISLTLYTSLKFSCMYIRDVVPFAPPSF